MKDRLKTLSVRLGGLGALLICLPVIWRIYGGDTFNPVSYFLWSALSLVCTVVLLRAGKGGVSMMAGYVLSDLAIGTFAYFHKGDAQFGKFEWFIVCLTIVCAAMYVWCEVRGNYTPSVIINASACLIAGIPQLVDIFKNPLAMSLMICWLYMLVSVLSFWGEKPTLNGRLIPGVSIIYWIVIIGGIMLARS